VINLVESITPKYFYTLEGSALRNRPVYHLFREHRNHSSETESNDMSNDSKEFALSQEIFEIGEECDVIQRIATDRFLRADEATQQLKTDDFF